jgi:TPR repeat protein
MRSTVSLIIISFFLLTNNCYASVNAKTDYQIGYEYYGAQNYEKAFNLFKQSAEQGYSDAQVHLGSMYEYGKGVLKDQKQAAVWYRKAAEQGHPDAQVHLGFMYEYGYGVLKYLKQAAVWYRKAAEQRHSGAQVQLGLIYAYGYGVPKNLKLAKLLIMRANELGDVNASGAWEALKLWKY